MLIFLGFFIIARGAGVPHRWATGSCFRFWAAARAGCRDGGVAFWAHAGGFLAGAPVLVFRDDEMVARHRTLARYV
jgi:membrane associated rhomboid family serine protease